MAKRSDQNNPEQKTQNGHNAEFSNELDPVVQVKQRNSKRDNLKDRSNQSKPGRNTTWFYYITIT